MHCLPSIEMAVLKRVNEDLDSLSMRGIKILWEIFMTMNGRPMLLRQAVLLFPQQHLNEDDPISPEEEGPHDELLIKHGLMAG